LTLSAVAAAVALVVSGCGRREPAVPPAPFWPDKVAVTAQPRLLFRGPTAPGAAGFHRYEYVFPDRRIDVYDVDRGFRLVARWSVPEAHSIRGVAVSPATSRLFFSVGGNGGSSGKGALVCYDLRRNRVLWERAFPTGTDSPAITPDGRTIFLPIGERTLDDVWYVVDAATGRVTHELHGGPGPHNTIVAPGGSRVYLGPRNSRYLAVASTQTLRILRRIGPLRSGVRPFTIDGSQTIAYTTATGFLGFQASAIATGRVLFTVPIRGFTWHHSLGTPSHGISLSPDNRQLAVIDVPNSYVHFYDVSRLPRRRPRHVADVRLRHGMAGRESPCGGDCGRAGWLQHSLDGRFVYVGDSGDVVDARTYRVTAFLPGLRNSRYLLELDWRGHRPVRTSTRSGFGYPGPTPARAAGRAGAGAAAPRR
jgi:DNA-binding beta-propeller fold protein YncE